MTRLLERPGAQKAAPGRTQFHTDFGFTRHVIQGEDDVKAAGLKLPNAAPKAVSGDLVLTGYANTWVQDRDFEVILKTAFDTTLDDYMRKNPILLWQHNHDWPLGQIGDAATDETGLGVVAYVRKPEAGEEPWKLSAYNDIKAGIVRTMSIGGWFTREVIDNIIAVTQVDLFEISIVSVPSNPDSIFEAATKSINGQPMRTGVAKGVAQMAMLLGMEPVSDPELVRLDDQAKRARYHRLAADVAEAKGVRPPDYDAWRTLVQELATAKPEKASDLAAKAEAIIASVHGVSPVTLSGGSKGAFTQVYDGYELQERLWDGFWAFREALQQVMVADSDTYLPSATIDVGDIVSVCNDFREWLVRTVQTHNSGGELAAPLGQDLKALGAMLGDRTAKEIG